MNHKIRKLLDKKKLMAKEFGTAYIITRTRHQINGEIILTDQELKVLSGKITEQSEINQANAYVNFYNWIDRSHLIAKSDYNDFYIGFSILYLQLGYTMKSEQGFNKLKITDIISEIDQNYQRLKDITESILFYISVFNQIKNKEDLENMRHARNTVKVALPNILTYNKAIDLFTDFFKIPEISQVFKIETDQLFTNISRLNDKIVLLKKFLYGTKEEVAKKLNILDDFYPIINIQDFEPNEDAIKKATDFLNEATLQSSPYEIMKILYPIKNNE